MKPSILFCFIILMIGNIKKPMTDALPTSTIKAAVIPGHEFLSMLPIQKIDEIEKQHLLNDDEFKAAILYLQSEDWKNIVADVLKTPEYQKFSNMTSKFHLNISQGISCLTKHIDGLDVKPVKLTVKPNMESFVKDVESVLQIGNIVTMLSSKSGDPKMKKLLEEISHKDNQKIAEDLHNLDKMVKLREVLKAMNFDVEPYLALIYTFLGWVH